MRIFIAFVAVLGIALANDAAGLCDSAEAQQSCGHCIKQHPLCGWCGDPHAVGIPRCQQNSSLTAAICNPQYVYSPKTEIRYPDQTLRLQALQPDGRTLVRLEPQQVFLKMKHGDKLVVPFKYYHSVEQSRYPIKKFYISTSDFHTQRGITLKFFTVCNGTEIEDRECDGIQDAHIYEFRLEITMNKCTNEGDISIAVGVHGQDTVTGVYITPLCGCECEKLQRHERNSPLCHNHGTLICGQCICEPSRGGDRCECPLATYGARTASELEQRCRSPSNTSLVCSGRGTCQCGTCECRISSGKYCECDSTTCPKGPDGNMCSGNGACECGRCICEPGFERDDCSCSSDRTSCYEGGQECSGHGHCECGRCVCDAGFTGAFCGAEEDISHVPEEPQSTSTESSDDKNDETAEGEKEELVTGSSRNLLALLVFFIPFY